MQFRFIARLGVLSAFLLVVVVRENARLFHSNATSLKLNATSGKMASYSRPQHLKANDADAEISTFSPPSCTADQLDMIYQRLPEVGENCGKLKGPCPISFMTRCPQASWLEDFYASQHRHQSETKKSFLAFNIGCNKGYDAVNLLRMGSNNPTFNRLTWKEAMPRNSKPGVCGQDKESAMALTSPASSNHGKENSALVYCIEPMPSTFLALQNATKTTGWDSHLKVLHLAMNNEDPSTVLFPKPGPGNLGVEAVGISNDCRVRPDKCLKVESSRLDLIMSKEQLTDKRVNVLLVDVEGFDFDVLQGGNSTLRNTEYVEFEFHQVGKVRSTTPQSTFSFCSHLVRFTHRNTLSSPEISGVLRLSLERSLSKWLLTFWMSWASRVIGQVAASCGESLDAGSPTIVVPFGPMLDVRIVDSLPPCCRKWKQCF